MKDDHSHSPLGGTFTLPDGADVYGEVALAGANSTLRLRDGAAPPIRIPADGCVHGILHDLTKVSLLDCMTLSSGVTSGGNGSYSSATLFPHYIFRGPKHIAADDAVISELRFVIDDASVVYYDFDAFGCVIDARPFIESIVRANEHGRDVPIGANPTILYFTGKTELFSVDTPFGRVAARHRPSMSFGGPDGVHLNNTIVTSLALSATCTFRDAFPKLLAVLQFLELILGRPQELLEIKVRLSGDQLGRDELSVHWSMRPTRQAGFGGERPSPGDILMNAATEPDDFGRVLSAWLGRHSEWAEARSRLMTSLSQGRYDVDRLIRSANMFDILPDSAVPQDAPLTEGLTAARDASRTLFAALPRSPERDSVLGALGRVGRSTLKRKIRHRAQLVVDAADSRFPDLLVATDEAVNCRNHFVHGGEAPFDYLSHTDLLMFFNDTLEFVFGASDLIEAGWDLRRWCERPSSMSHPFGRYRVTYLENIGKLHAALGG